MKNAFRKVADEVGRMVKLPCEPQRIVSLCPSQTETLYALGLERQIIGRTRYCIHPKKAVGAAQVIGGTKKIAFEKLEELNPDLIIGEKEENTPQMIAALENKYPVYITDVKSVDGAVKMIKNLGDICAKNETAIALAEKIKHSISAIHSLKKPFSVIYLIWRNPYMIAGGQTYISDILRLQGFKNIGLQLPGRYPQLSIENLKNMSPDVVLLSSEPYPFREKHIEELKRYFPKAVFLLIDGEMYSWYGVRMVKAVNYLNQLLMKIESKL